MGSGFCQRAACPSRARAAAAVTAAAAAAATAAAAAASRARWLDAAAAAAAAHVEEADERVGLGAEGEERGVRGVEREGRREGAAAERVDLS